MSLMYFTDLDNPLKVFPDISNRWANLIYSQAFTYLRDTFGLDVSGCRYHICPDPMATKIRTWKITFTRPNGAKIILTDVVSNSLGEVIQWGLEKIPELCNV